MRIVPVLSVVVCLGACGDPLSGIATVSDVDVAQSDPAAAALPAADEIARDGFLGTAAAEGDNAVVDAAVAAANAQTTPAEEPAKGGFLRGLINRAADANPEAVEAATAKAAAEQAAEAAVDAAPTDAVVIETRPTVSASVELAALPEEPVSPREELGQRKRGIGLFGGGRKKNVPRTGPDAQEVTYGTALPFGQIARVCDARGKALGTKVEGTGRRGFALYDSQQGVRNKRTFYITGFDDNCPRQFTAANALLGVPSFYEDLRFGPTGKFLPYAATDKAYDTLKSKVCRAGKNKPCGKNMAKMDSSTVFVSAYEFGEHNKGWKEFLVHDGEVLASARK